MQIDVPFIPNEENDCGPVAIQMVLRYFSIKAQIEEVRMLAEPETNGMTYTLGLGVAAARFGCKVHYCTVSIGTDPHNLTMDFYRKHAGDVRQINSKTNKLLATFLQEEGKIEIGRLSLENIISRISQRTIPIVLVDYNKLIGKEGYQGHFLPVVGYTDSAIIVHQPGPEGAQPFFHIRRDLFEEARTAKGTDEDVLFISNPHPPPRKLI